jgi:hypothetical protein
MTKKISALALVLAFAGHAYADPPPQQIAFPPVVGPQPAPVTPSNPFPVEEQGGQGVDGSIRIALPIDASDRNPGVTAFWWLACEVLLPCDQPTLANEKPYRPLKAWRRIAG